MRHSRVRLSLYAEVCAAVLVGCGHAGPSTGDARIGSVVPPGRGASNEVVIDVHGPFGGQPLPGAAVELSDSRGRQVTRRTDAAGEARFDKIPSGKYEVEVHHAQALGQRFTMTVAGKTYQTATLISPFLQASGGETPPRTDILQNWLQRVPPVLVLEERSGGPATWLAIADNDGKYEASVVHIENGQVIQSSKRPLDSVMARAVVCTWRSAIDRATPPTIPIAPEILDGARYRFTTVQNGRWRTAVTTTLSTYLDDGPRARALRMERAIHEFAEGHIAEALMGSVVAGALEPSCRTKE
jgi:hypothetical protein